jgi:hypothetical protein
MSAHPAPSTDADTHEVLDDAVLALATRRGAWLGEATVMIHQVASLIAQAHRFLPILITEALQDGATWDDIATLLGTSPDDARWRYDPQSPLADGRPPFDL